MNTSLSLLGRTALVASFVGLAGASQAAVVTVSASWDASPIDGTASSGATTFASAASPLASLTSLSWDDVADLGVTRTFTFSAPMSVTVTSGAPSLENYFKATSVIFTGAGTAVSPGPFSTPLFTQSFTVENLGTDAKITYNGSDGTVLYTSDFGGKQYSWAAKFASQPAVVQSLGGGSTTYSWSTASLNVTLVSAVPEPATLALFGLGLVPVLIARRRRLQA